MKIKIITGIILAVLVAGGIYIQIKSGGIKGDSKTPKDSGEEMALQDYGKAPEFAGISKWINSDPLTMSSLKGKVVLVDFWTYSCINCIRTLPYVTKLYDTYKDKGLVVVGVHTPEFAFEKLASNVQDAVKRHKINYPVALDNDFATWNAFSNQYWPAEYLINKDGNVVYTHFGEGNYQVTENAIQQLLELNMADVTDSPTMPKIQSPEMYFGTARTEYMENTAAPSAAPKDYQYPALLSANHFAVSGTWQFDEEEAVLVSSSGGIRLRFNSGKAHMVAASDKPVKVKIKVDGKDMGEQTVSESMLYTLFDSDDYREHLLELEIEGEGLRAFTFTFG